MTFAPLDVFRRVKAAHARYLRCFHALAVETSSRRMLVASSRASNFGAQTVMQPLPFVTSAPKAKVIIDALPFGKIFRQHPPLNAADHHIENGINDLTHLEF